MPERIHGGVFNQQIVTGSQRYFVIEGADFSGAVKNGQPVAHSAAEIIFEMISQRGYINIMNPYDTGISFALEINRSNWDQDSLEESIRALGTDVGVDNIDCAVCTVSEVPFNFQYLSPGGSSSFIGLDDVTVPSIPNGYVLWDPTGTTLQYSTTIPYTSISGAPPITNEVIVEDEGGTLGTATTLNFVGDGVSVALAGATATVTVSGNSGYTVALPGDMLLMNTKYFVPTAGTVFLPDFTTMVVGSFVTVAKSPPNTSSVFVVSDNGVGSIVTDIGSTDAIEIDSSTETTFIYDGVAWALQIGSIA